MYTVHNMTAFNMAVVNPWTTEQSSQELSNDTVSITRAIKRYCTYHDGVQYGRDKSKITKQGSQELSMKIVRDSIE